MPRAVLQRMCPFFIVSDVAQSISFYRDKLAVEICYQKPDQAPFFAMLGRDGAQLLLKAGCAMPNFPVVACIHPAASGYP